MSELFDAALRYLPRSLPLLGKLPAVGAGWPNWPATEETVTAWFAAHPDANIGIRTGGGLVAVDVDRPHGEDTLAELEREYGALPATPTVITGGGGRHHYFRGPLELRSRNLRSIGLAGLEIAAAGRQLVAPPSRHPETGRLYVWHPAHPLIASELAELPAWLVELAGGDPRPVPVEGAIDLDDPLRDIPATVYVPLLTGHELGRDHKCLCPFHDELEPSLHAYPADRGWYCFGCGRGGSAIDLGAALWGIEPRGRGFHDLRRRLAVELLASSAA